MPVPIVYQNFVPPAIDAGNLNTVNNVVYTVIGDGTNAPLNAANVRTNIGLGTMATQNANAVNITGGSVGGATVVNPTTPIAVANGGTGTTIAPPIFSAFRSGTQSIPSGSFTEIVMNATEFDSNSWFNTTTGRYTPQVAGYYQINGSVTIAVAAGFTTNFQVQLNKNGVAWKRGAVTFTISNDNASMSATVSTVVFLNGTTDFVSLYTFSQISAGTQVANGSAAETWLNGYFIRS